MANGFLQVGDLWCPSRQLFLAWPEAQVKFELRDEEEVAYDEIIHSIPPEWPAWLTTRDTNPKEGEFIGVFEGEISGTPELVLHAREGFWPVISQEQHEVRLSRSADCFLIGSTGRLRPRPESSEIIRLPGRRTARVRVVTAAASRAKSAPPARWFAGIVARLNFDPGRWRWRKKGPLCDFSVKKGRELLRPVQELSRSIPEKWHGTLPSSYKPDWRDVWHASKPQKESGFMWSVYHHAIAVNEWCHQMCPQTDRNCPSCLARVPKTIMHRFVECKKASHAWNFAQTVFNVVMEVPLRDGKWDPLTWQQCLLGSPLPRKLRKGRSIWRVLRCSVIWIMWLDRNADCFSEVKWTSHLRELKIWEAMVEVVRTAWDRTVSLMTQYPAHQGKFLDRFDNCWLPTVALAERRGTLLCWHAKRPALGAFRD